jgi:signal transduction histidine kinase
MTNFDPIAFLGTPDNEMARELAAIILGSGRRCQLTLARNLTQLRAHLSISSPIVVLLDEMAVKETGLEATARKLAVFAPVIVLASVARQNELSALIAEGDVEFVARVGDFVPLVASLIERRIRWAERSDTVLGPAWMYMPKDFGEILRHEINNPLTGVLGNAELLLCHREHLSPLEIQRLETIVDLAVRLRETIRRLSNSWPSENRQLRAS